VLDVDLRAVPPQEVEEHAVHRPEVELPLSCETCEVGITGKPIIHEGLPFCCAGCLAGRECSCSIVLQGNARVRHCLDVSDPPTWPPMASSSRGLALSGR
jgi:hypothetical protein